MSTTPDTAAGAELGAAAPHIIAPELVEVTDGVPHLLGGKCQGCGALSFPKAHVCPQCLSLDIAATHIDSAGVLYSFAIVHQAPKGWDVPYALGYVDLPDGIRVLAHIGGDLDKIGIDQRVRLGLARVGADATGAALTTYVFTPATGAGK